MAGKAINLQSIWQLQGVVVVGAVVVVVGPKGMMVNGVVVVVEAVVVVVGPKGVMVNGMVVIVVPVKGSLKESKLEVISARLPPAGCVLSNRLLSSLLYQDGTAPQCGSVRTLTACPC